MRKFPAGIVTISGWRKSKGVETRAVIGRDFRAEIGIVVVLRGQPTILVHVEDGLEAKKLALDKS